MEHQDTHENVTLGIYSFSIFLRSSSVLIVLTRYPVLAMHRGILSRVMATKESMLDVEHGPKMFLVSRNLE